MENTTESTELKKSAVLAECERLLTDREEFVLCSRFFGEVAIHRSAATPKNIGLSWMNWNQDGNTVIWINPNLEAGCLEWFIFYKVLGLDSRPLVAALEEINARCNNIRSIGGGWDVPREAILNFIEKFELQCSDALNEWKGVNNDIL